MASPVSGRAPTHPFELLMVLVLRHQGCYVAGLELQGPDPSGDPAFNKQGQGPQCMGTPPVLSREAATALLPGAQRRCYPECTYS